MASTLRWDRKIWVRALTMSLLGGCLGSGMGMTDDALEKELQRQYQTFSPMSIAPGTAFVGKAVQFVQHLLDNPDDSLGKKLALLIGKGAGVGGISSRSATEAERQILFSGIYKAKELGSTEQDFLSPVTDTVSLLARHQSYVATVYQILPEPIGYTPSLKGWVNFSQKIPVYEALVQKARIHQAVKTQDWEGLKDSLAPDMMESLRSKISSFSLKTQVHLVQNLLSLPKEQQSAFMRKALLNHPDSEGNLSTLNRDLKNVFWGPDLLGIEDIILGIPEKEREQFTKDVLTLVKQGLTLTGSGQEETCLPLAFLLSKIKEKSQRAEFLKTLQETNLISFLHSGSDYFSVLSVMSKFVLSQIPVPEREKVMLFFQQQGNQAKQLGIQILADSPEGEDFQYYVKTIHEFLKEIYGDPVYELLKIMVDMPSALRVDFMHQLLGLNLEYKSDRKCLIQFLSQIPSYQSRQNFLNSVQRLFKTVQTQAKKWEIIDTLKGMSTDKRSQVVEHASLLLEKTSFDKYKSFREDLIKQLASFERDRERLAFVQASQNLFVENMDDYKLKQIRNYLQGIPSEQWENFSQKVASLKSRQGYDHDLMMSRLASVASQNRQAFVDFVVNHPTLGMGKIISFSQMQNPADWQRILDEERRNNPAQTIISTYKEDLGLGPNATKEEVRTAYRRLVLVHHPDRGGTNEAFQKIQNAYEKLMNLMTES